MRFGDLLVLLRLNDEPKGMIALAYAVSAVTQGPHWDPTPAAAERSEREISHMRWYEERGQISHATAEPGEFREGLELAPV